MTTEFGVWTRHASDGPQWSLFGTGSDFTAALMEFVWATVDPYLHADLYADYDPGDPWQVQVRGPSGAIRHYWSSDERHEGALWTTPTISPPAAELALPARLECGSCGHVLNREDCFCDGIVCTNCGEIAHARMCDGRGCMDGCTQSFAQKHAQLAWLIEQNTKGGCPWRPCGSADCAQWGQDPATCSRLAQELVLEFTGSCASFPSNEVSA